jgi:quercetin dioxygenase-like cupin family protein
MDSVTIEQWPLSGSAPDAIPGTGATMRQIHITAGTASTRHSHPYEQFLRVLTGGGKLECEAGSITLQPGTAIRFAPGAWHSAVFTEATVLLEINLAEAS